MRYGKKPVVHQQGARYWRRIAMNDLGYQGTFYEVLTRHEQKEVNKAAKALRLAKRRNTNFGDV